MSQPKQAPAGRVYVLAALLLTVWAPVPVRAARGENPEQGVFLRLATLPAGSYESTLQALRGAVAGAGWTVLADYESGVNRARCAFHARVLVVHWPEYARAVVREGAAGAFAAPVRLTVFEDERGVHVAAVNPRSLARTIVAEQGRDAEWSRLGAALEAAVHARLPGSVAQYGQLRDRGRIGRTMGVMAGGAFEGKIREVVQVQAGTEGVRGVARRLYEGLEKQAAVGEWRLRPVFLEEVGARDAIVLGIAGEPMESKSFDIVGAGGDDARKQLACPGIDHAAAYPLELLLVQEGQTVHVRTVDEMFRMKMYFEDAGMMAFARNMGMPGSIGGELRRKIAAVLGPTS